MIQNQINIKEFTIIHDYYLFFFKKDKFNKLKCVFLGNTLVDYDVITFNTGDSGMLLNGVVELFKPVTNIEVTHCYKITNWKSRYGKTTDISS